MSHFIGAEIAPGWTVQSGVVTLMGSDTQLTTNEMQEFKSFLPRFMSAEPVPESRQHLPTNSPLVGSLRVGFNPPPAAAHGNAQRGLNTIYGRCRAESTAGRSRA